MQNLSLMLCSRPLHAPYIHITDSLNGSLSTSHEYSHTVLQWPRCCCCGSTATIEIHEAQEGGGGVRDLRPGAILRATARPRQFKKTTCDLCCFNFLMKKSDLVT